MSRLNANAAPFVPSSAPSRQPATFTEVIIQNNPVQSTQPLSNREKRKVGRVEKSEEKDIQPQVSSPSRSSNPEQTPAVTPIVPAQISNTEQILINVKSQLEGVDNQDKQVVEMLYNTGTSAHL